MTPQAVRKIGIIGAVLILAAFIAKHIPIQNGYPLPQVWASCQMTPHYLAPSDCTQIAYEQFASGLVMIAGLALAGYAVLWSLVRSAVTWVAK